MSCDHETRGTLHISEIEEAARLQGLGIPDEEIAAQFNVKVAEVANRVGLFLRRKQIENARFEDTQSQGKAQPQAPPTMAELCKPISARGNRLERASESRRQATQIMHLAPRSRLKPGPRRT